MSTLDSCKLGFTKQLINEFSNLAVLTGMVLVKSLTIQVNELRTGSNR